MKKIKSKISFLEARSSKLVLKKSLGQHFLHNAHYLRKVADAADITRGEVVVEVGPGDGALTEKLLAFSCQVIGIEKDARLIPVLKEKFRKEILAGQLILVEGDILQFDPSDWKLKAHRYKLVGNIPYYITGALLKKFLSGKVQPSTLVFLMQKEVAQRIVRAKKESILSLSVKAYGESAYVASVPRGAFTPPPKVDSAIMRVRNISRKNFRSAAHEKKFFELIKNGFGKKRKFLASNLKSLLGPQHSNILQNVGINPRARAEDVPLRAWLALSKVEGLELSKL